MTNINSWKIKCVTEGIWKHGILKYENESAPTTCPDNTNHEVVLDSAVIEKVIKTDVTRIVWNQTELIDPMTAITKVKGFILTLEPEVDVSSMVVSFPYDIDIICGYVKSKDSELGDYIDLLGMPLADSAIGIVAEDAAQDATIVKINSGAYSNMRKGLFVVLGSDPKEYEIKSCNDATEEVTLVEGLDSAKTTNDPVKIRRKYLDRYYICCDEKDCVSNEVKEASGLKETMQLKLNYYHVQQKTEPGVVCFWLVYRY